MVAGVGVVDLDLVGEEWLEVVVGLRRLRGHCYLLHVVEYALQFVEANVTLVLSFGHPKVPLNIVILLNPQPSLPPRLHPCTLLHRIQPL